MILDYNRKPDATVDEKIQSLMENTQLALNDIIRAQQTADVAKEDAQTSVALSQTARQAANEASESAARAKEAADEATEAVEEIEGDVSGLTTRVAQAESDIETAEGNITSLTGRVSDAEGDITTIEGNVSSLTGRVADAEADISTAEGNISTLQSDVATAQGNISTIQGNITNLSGRVSDAESDITTVEGNITTLTGRVSDAEDEVEDVMKGLALAEDVVGTLNWITAHSSVTTDTVPDPDTTYYIKHLDGTFEVVTDTTGKNPAQEGWYVLDEALQNYVLAHLALTDDGLYVTADDSEWKVLIKSDGVYIINPQDEQVSKFKDVIQLGTNPTKDTSAVYVEDDGLFIKSKSDLSPFRNYDLASIKASEGWVKNSTGKGFNSNWTYTVPFVKTPANGNPIILISEDIGSYRTIAEFKMGTSKSVELERDYGTLSYDGNDKFTYSKGLSGSTSVISILYKVYKNSGNPVLSIGTHPSLSMSNITSSFKDVLEATATAKIGNGLTANYSYQTVLGKYNHNESDSVFEIGNGSGSLSKSNAFRVDWDGNVEASGDIEDGSGNVLSDMISQETDPTVPSWAKASSKPTYTASEISGLIDLVHPVWTTYATLDPNFNPNVSWGGTWEKLPEGYVLLSGSDSGSYIVGDDTSTASGYKEYGENTHTLVADELPSHTHGNKTLTGAFTMRRFGTSDGQAVWANGIMSLSQHSQGNGYNIAVANSQNKADAINLNASHEHTSVGLNQAHNIMQKSIAVYCWIRTA